MNCLECDKDSIGEHEEQISFPIIGGIELSVVVPVLRCQKCKFGWTDYRAEEIRDAAVERYLQARDKV